MGLQREIFILSCRFFMQYEENVTPNRFEHGFYQYTVS